MGRSRGVVLSAAGFHDDIVRNRRKSAAMLTAVFLLLGATVNAVAFALGGYSHQVCTAVDPTLGGVANSYIDVNGVSTPANCTSTASFRPAVLAGTLGVVVLYLIIAYFFSGRATLAMVGAQPADPAQFPVLHNVVEEMSIAAGLPKPSVWVVDDAAPNAFASGRDPKHSSITVTTGLLSVMSRRELEGVIAHETSHIANHDISVSTLAVLAVGAVVAIADVALRIAFYSNMFGGGRRSNDNDGAQLALLALSLLLYLLAVPAALLLKAALSRRREAMADETGVQLTREPGGLRSALEKLEADTSVVAHPSHAAAHLWIESPLRTTPDDGIRGWLSRAFDTHPPLADRIAQLRTYEGLDPNGRGPNDAVPAGF